MAVHKREVPSSTQPISNSASATTASKHDDHVKLTPPTAVERKTSRCSPELRHILKLDPPKGNDKEASRNSTSTTVSMTTTTAVAVGMGETRTSEDMSVPQQPNNDTAGQDQNSVPQIPRHILPGQVQDQTGDVGDKVYGIGSGPGDSSIDSLTFSAIENESVVTGTASSEMPGSVSYDQLALAESVNHKHEGKTSKS